MIGGLGTQQQPVLLVKTLDPESGIMNRNKKTVSFGTDANTVIARICLNH